MGTTNAAANRHSTTATSPPTARPIAPLPAGCSCFCSCHSATLGIATGRPQPSQKLFESRLLAALDLLDADELVVSEAESSKIGDRMLPPALWTRLTEAPRIELSATLADRAAYLAATYGEITADRGALDAAF